MIKVGRKENEYFINYEDSKKIIKAKAKYYGIDGIGIDYVYELGKNNSKINYLRNSNTVLFYYRHRKIYQKIYDIILKMESKKTA